MTRRALIVEDDADIATLVEVNLRDIDCQATIARDGLEGLRQATEGLFDVIILDIMLPGLSGIEVCRRLREQHVSTPILMLTARHEEIDKVLALDLGADDYLTKPFSVRELLARVKARLRRSVPDNEPGFAAAAAPTRFARRDLLLDTELHRVTVGGKVVDLTAKEFDLLALFLRHPGRTYTRTQLLDQVWGYSYTGYEHTVNSHINRLRMKIEADAARPEHILTVWGVGYKLNDELT
ncbi:two component transcriptional regulator, winged helix family [Hymenobacter roseosalivarius DSM 11622]|uniref:Phosphate regulon transcriptional regulatory protein PhoB n=1 Tax=Hymenobacter roseosalivarius DSM 11622 TaxID=645990 RepID=A0A1W1VZ07_9BACT|nr:response regulator transcription factor [Hymenobacter roseosalivarius]SMB98597.1 two component transcriptional regulator, winged helix family [Hymenobacter roseosalivarius DSM 11622]